MADSTIEIHQTLKLSVQGTDGRGNSVRFLNTPLWVSGDNTIINITSSPDGLSATASPQKIGIVDITVSADGLTGIWNIEVTGPRIIFQAMTDIN